MAGPAGSDAPAQDPTADAPAPEFGALNPSTTSVDGPAITDPDASVDLGRLVQQAADQSVGVELVAGTTYRLTQPLTIPDTVTYLDGNGATIDVAISSSAANPEAAITLAMGSTGTVLTNATIDLTDSPDTRGVSANAVSRVTISHLTLTGGNRHGIDIAAGDGPVSDVVIADNTVTISGSQPAWVLYVGTGSSRTTFSGNTVTGSAYKALIGIESV